MPVDDPNTWLQATSALKAGFDAFRGAIGLIKDARGLSAESPEQARAITAALDTAEANTQIAEAEIAKALGYELCKCEFPPTPMLTVGKKAGGQAGEGPVFECPKCGYNNAGMWNYTRTEPRRG